MKKSFMKFASFAALAAVAVMFTACSDDDSTPASSALLTEVNGVYHFEGDVTEDLTLDSGNQYVITGSVHVKSGAKLTIPAGMTVQAKTGFTKYILVECGGKIMAEGTATAPITFECDEAGYQWGGIVINGKAPIAGAKAAGSNTGLTEIDNSVAYGGDISDDNSGVLKYVIITESGAKSSGSVEHNGLTLNGVGSGTTIENIFVNVSTDDGIEFFGGTVNVTNLLVVDSDDDLFDFTQGYTGTLKNCYGVWTAGFTSGEEDPRGVEADGNLDGKTPGDNGQSNFKIVNMTIDNRTTGADGTKMHDVIKVRRGASATITNARYVGLSTNIVSDLVDLEDGKGAAKDVTISIDAKNCPSQSIKDSVTGTAKIDVAATSNTGCAQSEFAWTGFKF